MHILDIQNVQKSFGDNHVLKDISLTVDKGEVVSVIGPSGSGKSTFLELLVRETNLTHGDIYFGDFEPYEFDSGNQAASVSAPSMDVPQDSYGDDLPF